MTRGLLRLSCTRALSHFPSLSLLRGYRRQSSLNHHEDIAAVHTLLFSFRIQCRAPLLQRDKIITIVYVHSFCPRALLYTTSRARIYNNGGTVVAAACVYTQASHQFRWRSKVESMRRRESERSEIHLHLSGGGLSERENREARFAGLRVNANTTALRNITLR